MDGLVYGFRTAGPWCQPSSMTNWTVDPWVYLGVVDKSKSSLSQSESHHHHHHRRCTVGQRTPTSPSSQTATACSARSRPPMERRATHSSSATHSPLEPRTHSAMVSLTHSGLSCSTQNLDWWRFVCCQKRVKKLGRASVSLLDTASHADWLVASSCPSC